MYCPFCSAEDTKVVDSRIADDGSSVRRRRECTICGERFTTYENAQLRMPQLVKSDGRREAFSEDKLRAGIKRALEKRPVDAEAMEAAIGRLRHRLISIGEREVSARQLGEWVMNELQELDAVAYVRFASVYRSFSDIDAFSDEVKRLRSEPSAETRRKQLKLILDSKKK
ncbi:MAG: transcriptional regulator NrdR [Acidiferrobacterales bacterium]